MSVDRPNNRRHCFKAAKLAVHLELQHLDGFGFPRWIYRTCYAAGSNPSLTLDQTLTPAVVWLWLLDSIAPDFTLDRTFTPAEV